MIKYVILLLGIFTFYGNIRSVQPEVDLVSEIDTLSPSYKIILDIPVNMDKSGYIKLLDLCDSLGIEVSCLLDQPSYPIEILENNNNNRY